MILEVHKHTHTQTDTHLDTLTRLDTFSINLLIHWTMIQSVFNVICLLSLLIIYWFVLIEQTQWRSFNTHRLKLIMASISNVWVSKYKHDSGKRVIFNLENIIAWFELLQQQTHFIQSSVSNLSAFYHGIDQLTKVTCMYHNFNALYNINNSN